MTNLTSLDRAVIRKLGDKSYLQDVAEHGADGGFPGFTYYSDTCDFYAKHQSAIVKLVKQMADDLGEEPISMVKGFRCLNGNSTEEEVAQTLYGTRSKHDTQVANALAWFALEEVARKLTDE